MIIQEKIIVIIISLIEPIKIKKGQKIAQLIVSNITYPEIKLVKFLKDTERNDKVLGKMDNNDNYLCIYGRMVNF